MLEEVKKYKNNKLLGAYLLKDEPKFDELKEVEEIFDLIYETDENHMTCVNLACDNNRIGNLSSYAEYLEYIQNLLYPPVWFYDYYPIRFSNGKTYLNDNEFYYYLQMYYDVSVRTKRPFWTHCLCMPLLSSCKVNLEGTDACDPYSLSSSGIPIPTEGQLRFEAFNALAYGAQGIAFWFYTQRTRNKDEKYFQLLSIVTVIVL